MLSTLLRPAPPRLPGALLLAGLLAVAVPAAGADLSVRPAAAPQAEIGKDLVLTLVVTVPTGSRLQADGLELSVVPEGPAFFGAPYPLRPLDAPAGDGHYTDEFRLEWAAPVPADVAPADRPLVVTLTGLSGAGEAVTATWNGTVAVGYGKEWSADRITDFIERRGMLPFLALVFGFGLLMSLSPCIYPMIPITLAVIGAQSQEKGALHGLVMSVTYVIGMALVYAVLGALSATVFSGITAFMQSPAVLIPIAVLLVALAFSMFGAYELQAPAFLRDRLSGPGGRGRGGLLGVFLMGLVAGLVASPCVGPFLAALLVWVATTGNWVLGFCSLFTFGIGMGLLLIGVGTFPALLGTMPRSGGWMDTVKRAMGLLLLAMAFYFVRPGMVLPARIFTPLVGGVVVLVAVFLGAFDPVGPGSRWWDRTRKGLGLIVLVTGLALLGQSLLAGRLPAGAPAALPVVATTPAPTAAATAPLPDKVQWTRIHTGENVAAFLGGQLAAAKAAGRPVMIDFWANWCVYCKKLDKAVWNVPEVVAEAQRFTTIKIDATAPDDAEMAAIKERYQVPGLPRVIFIDSRGEVLQGRASGFKEAEEMLEVMRSVR